MRKIDLLLAEYGESHQNSTNKAIHWICVPAIFFSLIALLWSIPSGPLQEFYPSVYMNWATMVVLIAFIYWLRLSISLAIGMLIFSALCLWKSNFLSEWFEMPLWQISLIVFTLAWIGQFYGHKIEGKKPSFLKDIQFLMIGPAWLLHFIYRKLGIPY